MDGCLIRGVGFETYVIRDCRNLADVEDIALELHIHRLLVTDVTLNTVEKRPATLPVVLVLGQTEAVAVLPFDEGEWAGAHDFRLGVRSLDVVFVDDVEQLDGVEEG